MKKGIVSLLNVFILLFLFFPVFTSNAQQDDKCILDKLVKSKAGKGTIRIQQDSKITALIGRHKEGAFVEQEGDSAFIRGHGFRIQLYMGNNPQKSKAEVYNLEKTAKELFPTMRTYVRWNSPFWKLKIGDFTTWEEADKMLREIKTNHKAISKNAFIIKDEIRLDF